ncbi:MAG: hypothetical protein WC110_09130 [Bacteroidales bacterium]|jgi:hypothetical protein
MVLFIYGDERMKKVLAILIALITLSMMSCNQTSTTEDQKYWEKMSSLNERQTITIIDHDNKLQNIYFAFFKKIDDDTTLYYAPDINFYIGNVPTHNEFIIGYFTVTINEDNSFKVEIVSDSFLEKLFGD